MSRFLFKGGLRVSGSGCTLGGEESNFFEASYGTPPLFVFCLCSSHISFAAASNALKVWAQSVKLMAFLVIHLLSWYVFPCCEVQPSALRGHKYKEKWGDVRATWAHSTSPGPGCPSLEEMGLIVWPAHAEPRKAHSTVQQRFSYFLFSLITLSSQWISLLPLLGLNEDRRRDLCFSASGVQKGRASLGCSWLCRAVGGSHVRMPACSPEHLLLEEGLS